MRWSYHVDTPRSSIQCNKKLPGLELIGYITVRSRPVTKAKQHLAGLKQQFLKISNRGHRESSYLAEEQIIPR